MSKDKVYGEAKEGALGQKKEKEPNRIIFIIGFIFVAAGAILTCLTTGDIMVNKLFSLKTLILGITSFGSTLAGLRIMISQLFLNERQQKHLDFTAVFTSLVLSGIIIAVTLFL